MAFRVTDYLPFLHRAPYVPDGPTAPEASTWLPVSLFKHWPPKPGHDHWPPSHGHKPPPTKPVDEYGKLGDLEARDPHGANNNPQGLGAADTSYSRETTNSYVDGIGEMPANLPTARAVSDAVMNGGTSNIPSSFGVNEWFDFFGQALTHDVAEASTAASGDPPQFIPGLPFPFGRTPFEGGIDTPRQQINEETSFLDLSFVYGNSQERLDLARADLSGHSGQSAKLLLGQDGLLPTIKEVGLDAGKTSLEVLTIMRPDGFGGLPNPATNPDPATFENLYYAGDNRVNQQGPLISLQTVWAREHNYQVDKLATYAEKYNWTQDQLFEAARAITEAEWQQVIYNEYVPKLLGKNALSEYEGYKENVDPSIINEWTTVAFRFGHDQSSNDFTLLNENGSSYLSVTLGSAFALAGAAANVPGAGHSTEDIDAWIRGLTSQHAQEIDGKVVDGNRNLLFGIPDPNNPGQVLTVDLETFDIQRGRDHGVWNYNDLREGLGLSTYGSFDEFAAANGLDADTLNALEGVYGDDINKLDSVVGGLLEAKYEDSQLGQTFTLLNVMQFENLRDGDKLYYENRFADNPELLAQIKNTSFADIIERNSDVDYLYHDAFAAHTRVSGTGQVNGTEQKDLVIGSDAADVMRTYGGNDDVYGGKGNDKVYAGAGNDLVYGGEGHDWLWGNAGYDVFAFAANSGRDKVLDFNVKEDKLDLSDYGFDSWKDVKTAMHATRKGVVIELDAHNSVELIGVKTKYLSEKNFILDDPDSYVA